MAIETRKKELLQKVKANRTKDRDFNPRNETEIKMLILQLVPYYKPETTTRTINKIVQSNPTENLAPMMKSSM